ncbi:MAG: hypothetical protein ACRDRM_01010, partial [Pseudonocardiaceae bacterium]
MIDVKVETELGADVVPGDGYDLQVPDLFMNPHPLLHRMRRDDPVYFSRHLDSWVLTRHDDVT